MPTLPSALREAAAWLQSVSWKSVARRLQGMIRRFYETRRAGG
jgi:hypothetical protein